MKKLFKLFLIVTVLVGFCGFAFAQDAATDDAAAATDEVVMDDAGTDAVVDESAVVEPTTEVVAPAAYQKGDAVELTGVIAVTPADEAKGEKFATVTLQVGEDTYKLLPAEAKEAFNGLEAAAGKTVNVKGTYLPADETHPMAAVKVTEWSE